MKVADHTGRLTSLQATRLTDCLTRTIHQTPSDRIVETGRKNDCFKKFEDLHEASRDVAKRCAPQWSVRGSSVPESIDRILAARRLDALRKMTRPGTLMMIAVPIPGGKVFGKIVIRH